MKKPKGLSPAAAGTLAAAPPADPRPTIVGKRITGVRPMTKAETDTLGWFPGYGDAPMVIVLEDGTLLVPQRDPEGNGPGMVMAMGARTVPTADPTRRAVETFADLVGTDGRVGRLAVAVGR